MSADPTRKGHVTEIFSTWYRDVRLATALLTRLPVPKAGATDRPTADVMRAFPVVGAGVGLAAGVVFGAGSWLDMPPLAAAFLALAVAAALTAALHEQGFAAVAEGLGSGGSHDDKLRIMRDRRIGALGVVALILLIGTKAAAIAGFHSPEAALAALVGAGAASRAAIPIFMNAVPLAAGFDDGDVARPGAGDAWAAAAVGAFFALFVGIEMWLVVLIVCTAVGFLLRKLVLWQIGGRTGPVLGLVQGVVETVFLVTTASVEF